jgi:fructose-1,6-bisphosphatase/inositol monophosphatase family enzyme
MLACTEAGAVVADARGRPLAVTDPAARRQVLAAATPELLEELRSAVAP